MKNILTSVCLLIFVFSTNVYAGEWNGLGVIERMYLYPAYAVIIQGPQKPGSAGCEDSHSWSFNWSQFDESTQQRIMSALLAAKLSSTPISVVVSETNCGPENKKLFTGQIQFR